MSIRMYDQLHDIHSFQQKERGLYNKLHRPVRWFETHARKHNGNGHTICTCKESLSASLYTATVLIPSFFAVRITRHAISPLVSIQMSRALHHKWTHHTCSRPGSYQSGVSGKGRWLLRGPVSATSIVRAYIGRTCSESTPGRY